MLNWPTLNLPPINLYTAPRTKEPCKHTAWIYLHPEKRLKRCYFCGMDEPATPVYKEQCQHTAWMILASERRKRCWDCGVYAPLIDNPYPEHTR